MLPTHGTDSRIRPVWTARRLVNAQGLVLVCWLGLIATLVFLRHVHAAVLPAALPHESLLAFEIGATDLQTALIGLAVALPLAAVWLYSARTDRHVPPVAPVHVATRTVLIASAVGVSVLTFLMLFRPVVDDPTCATNRTVSLNSYMRIAWNCDSSLFQQVAANPLRLFDHDHPRQARPVYALIGFVLVQTVGRVAGWLGFGNWQGEDARPYVALVLLNVLVLIAAVAIFALLLLRMGTTVPVTAALAIAVALNGLTIQWTLTPHQQTFAMLVPVGTVLAARQVLVDPPTVRSMSWWGLGLGVAANAYGSWLIAVPVIVIALVLRLRRAAAARVITFLGTVSAPILAWIAVCEIVTGHYYNHETSAYRQFVWIFDSLSAGPSDLWHRTTSYLLLTVRSVLGMHELWIAAALIAVGVVIAAVTRTSLRPGTPGDQATLSAVGLTVATTFLFLFGLGYYTPRLAAWLFPPMLMVVAWVYSRLLAGSSTWIRRVSTVAAGVGALAWIGWMLT